MAAKVAAITSRGFWLLLDERELFVAYARFPWFRGVAAETIRRVKRPAIGHLRWPSLDIDLAIESIENPARYPLMSKSRPATLKPARGERTPLRAPSRPRRSAGR